MPKKTKIPERNVKPVLKKKITSEPIRSNRSRVFQGYLIIMILLFIALSVTARLLPYFNVDVLITKEVQEIHWLPFDLLMKAISFIGYEPQAILIFSILIVLLFLMGIRWGAFIGLLGLTFSASAVTVIKDLIGRARPSVDLVHVTQRLNSPDFPSGHVVIYTVMFGYLAYLSYTLLKRSRLRKGSFTISSSLVLLVGPSRIYLGEHWASDVVAAYLLGSIILSLMIYFYEWGKDKYFVKKTIHSLQPV
jgi:undecaprenyl-diphosphatase